MRTAAATWVFVGVTVAAGAALAQTKDLPPAEALFYEGVRALHRDDYERARASFEQSLSLAPRGSVLLNLAKAEWALGRHVEAVKHLRAALQRSDLPPENRQSAERGLARWSAELGHIAVTADAGANIRIDGAAVEGNAPLADPVEVEPGLRIVETRLGDWTGRAEVEAKAGVTVEARAWVVRPAPTASPLAMPPEPVLTSGGAPTEPLAGAPPEALPPSSFWNARRVLGMGVVGAGVASLVVGGVFFARASSDERRATAATPPGLGPSGCVGASRLAACSSQDMAVSAERTDGTISRVAMGAGIAAAALGATALLWPSALRKMSVSASAQPQGAALALHGSF